MSRDRNDQFEYDVALSFAAEDRTVAEEFANLLRTKNIKVLSDEYQAVELGGSDFVTHIAELYRTKARFCVMLISVHYPLKKWTKTERTAARNHALRDAEEYILPVQVDDTELPGIKQAQIYRDLRQHSIEGIVDFLEQKLVQTKAQSSPPSQSHDLRSGNVSKTRNQP